MIQQDGNLVIFDKYDPMHTVSWASNTAYSPVYPPHVLYFRTNGDLELVNGNNQTLLWSVHNPNPHIEGTVYHAFVRCADGAFVLKNTATNQTYWTSNDEPWEAPHTSSNPHHTMPMTSMTMSHTMTMECATVTRTDVVTRTVTPPDVTITVSRTSSRSTTTTTTTRTTTTATQSPCLAKYGQCGGQGWTGATCWYV
ncbi:hypothetical protein HDV00_006891 [Rhizophlyctis rosea]|nr:hypothetical protein HDV00_006891 [Rhizophlyctis rosea]